MIRVDNLTRRYGSATAVDGISFEISPGEVVGFLGPNGAGKTTTLKILAGLLAPSSGTVTISAAGATGDALVCRGLIGYLPENNPLYEEMEVCEYLDWCASMRGLSGQSRRQALLRVVDRCGLRAVAGQGISELSKGYRQRVGLAAALVHDPPILLLDEPTSGLDPNQAVEILRLIDGLGKEKTVLLSSHILPEVQASCGRVIIIHKGKIAAQGALDDLRPSSGLQEERLRLALRRSGGLSYRVVSEELGALKGVLSAEEGLGRDELIVIVRVKPGAADLREEVLRLAAEKGWPVLELSRETKTLADLFRSLTA